MKALHLYSALDIHRHFLEGDVSAREIALYFLRRALRENGKLGAFLHICQDLLLQQADTLDRARANKEPLGPLAAVPVAIKDNTHIHNEPTTAGSKILATYRAPFDATVCRDLREAGVLFLGKTNLDEFAMGSSNENSAFFPARNPWRLSHVPGGSSGGSAVAVSSRLCPLATGSDTGGSVRQPAGFSGIVGYKPTYGRVSRHGLIAFGSSLDQIGPLASSVEEVAKVMEIIGHPCPFDATSRSTPKESYPLSRERRSFKVGVDASFFSDLSQDVQDNLDQARRTLERVGAKVLPVDLKPLHYGAAVYCILATAEASTNLARFDGIRYGHRSLSAQTLEEIYSLSRQEGFGQEVKKRILLGTYVLSAGFQEAYYRKAQKVRTLICQTFTKAFQQVDLILFPTTPSSAFKLGAIQDSLQMYLQDIFTIPANLAGLPAISIPSGFSSDHLPLGIQLMAPQGCDVKLIQLAYLYEQERGPFPMAPYLDDPSL